MVIIRKNYFKDHFIVKRRSFKDFIPHDFIIRNANIAAIIKAFTITIIMKLLINELSITELIN